MVTAEFQPFFTASVAATAALIGLLFVSVSIAPERVFGPTAEPVRQAQALSAFTALANIFFISMASLIPRQPFGIVVTVVTLAAVAQTLSLLQLLPHWRAERILWRGLILFAASVFIYAYELVMGIRLWRSPGDLDALISLLYLLLAAYAIGLGRAWELLGAPRSGLISSVVGSLSARLDRSRSGKPGPKE